MDNKLKNAADRIRMSDDLKKRILLESRNIKDTSEGGYEDSQEFTVERARPVRISRILPVAAACAVLVGGIGFAGVNLSRNESTSESLSEGSAVSEEFCQLPPFGDITQHTLAEVLRNSSPTELTEEQVQQIADLFARQNWEETEIPEEEMDDRHNIEYWFQFTDSTLDIVNEGFYICQDGILCFITPTGTLYYKTDFETIDTALRDILGYLPKTEVSEVGFEFTNVYPLNTDLTDEQKKELTEFFNDQEYIPVDIPMEEAAGNGIAYELAGWSDNWKNGEFMMLYKNGYFQFSGRPEMTRMYKVDYDSFVRKIGGIISENGGVTGEDAPFGEFEDPVFTITDLNETVQLHNIPYQSDELRRYFESLYWENAEAPENFGESNNGLLFISAQGSYTGHLAVDMDLGIARYRTSASGDIEAYDTESFYKFKDMDMFYAIYRWCDVPYDSSRQVCPFAAFLMGDERLRCSVDTNRVGVDENDIETYEERDDRLFGYIGGDEIAVLVDLLNEGMDWTDCTRMPFLPDNDEPIFSAFDFDNSLELYLYEDGMVLIRFNEEYDYICFKNIDGGKGILCDGIEKALKS